MAAKVFDVIVVGTGAGGGMAIKTLCEAGLTVCALNSGRRLDPAKDFRNHRQPYDMTYRGFGDPRKRDRYYHIENEYSDGLWEHGITYTTAPRTCPHAWPSSRCPTRATRPGTTAATAPRAATPGPSSRPHGSSCPPRRRRPGWSSGRTRWPGACSWTRGGAPGAWPTWTGR